MKYLLCNDILSFFKKYKKYIFIFFTIILLVPMVQLFCGIPISKSLFLDIEGLNFDINSGIISLLMFFLNLGFHLLVAFQIFDNDIKNGQENIFLRMSAKKWIICKIISLIMINTIIRLIAYIVVYAEFKFLNFNFEGDIAYYFFINIMFVMFFNLMFVNFYAVVKKNFKYQYLMIIYSISILILIREVEILKISIMVYIFINILL